MLTLLTAYLALKALASEQGAWEEVVAIAAAIVVVLIAIPVGEFVWNVARAGDRLALEGAQETIAELQSRSAQKLSDDEIIASFSDKTKQLLLSPRASELVRGQVGTNSVDESVLAELQEHELTTVAYVLPGPRGLAQYAVPRLNLTADGSRILRKVRGQLG